MKFLSNSDRQLFLAEAGYTPSVEITEGIISSFLKKRKKTVGILKDFRRSQLAKQQWRHNKYIMMKGIKKFHSSTKGKKFHRQLGRMIATRMFSPNNNTSMLGFLRNQNESFQDFSADLKSLSSMETHLFIPLDYYMPTTQLSEYLVFLEESFEAITSVKRSLLTGREIVKPDLDMVLACVSPDYLLDELHTTATGKSQPKELFEAQVSKWDSDLEIFNKSETPIIDTLAHLFSLK